MFFWASAKANTRVDERGVVRDGGKESGFVVVSFVLENCSCENDNEERRRMVGDGKRRLDSRPPLPVVCQPPGVSHLSVPSSRLPCCVLSYFSLVFVT